MTDELDHIWTVGADTTGEAGPEAAEAAVAYQVETLSGVLPLGPQLGVSAPEVVPAALAPVLLGGDPALQVFALLDGAKVDNLPERLEASDLPHACLFDNVEDLGVAAPWLVAVSADAPLTRQLFTQGQGPRALWDADTGVFLRSAEALPDLRARLRKFTKVRTEAGAAATFFRFWEPRVMARYLLAHDAAARAPLCALIGAGEMIAVDRHNDRAVHAVCQAPDLRAPRVWPNLREDLAPIRLEIFCEDLADRIATDIPPLAEVPRAERRETVTALVNAARAIGLRANKSVERYCLTALLIGAQPETDPRFAKVLNSDRHELGRSRLMLKLAKDL